MRGLARRDADAGVFFFSWDHFANICRKSIGRCGSRLNVKRAIYMLIVPVERVVFATSRVVR